MKKRFDFTSKLTAIVLCIVLTASPVLSACAPRPVFLPSVTRDWTVLNPTYEFEALKQVYKLFDAEDAIGGFHADAEHNYSQNTREHVYPWFTHWLLNQSLREPSSAQSMRCCAPAASHTLLQTKSLTSA